MAHASDDPARLTPHQRLTEIAAILARGFLRLRAAKRREAGALGECEPRRDGAAGRADVPGDR